jgi:hypothetical protein
VNNPLKPFWLYYGAKYRAASYYPKPKHTTLIEPFAGAAGYSLHYPNLKVILVEKYPVVAGVWRFLIATSSSEILRIPIVDAVDDLPPWVPQEARDLVGFKLAYGDSKPRARRTTNMALSRLASSAWTEKGRERVASQVDRIRHWKVVEGDYALAPDIEATWYIDPPYSNRAGAYYVHSQLDFPELGHWCRMRYGQVIVCENEGANWLPFTHLADIPSMAGGQTKRRSKEVIWTN